MSRAGRINRVTALLLAPLWLAGFVWTLHLEASDRLAYPVHVFVSAPTASAHPWVAWVWPDFAERPGGVRLGDALLSVGGRDMTGAGRFETIVAVLAAQRDFAVPVEVAREGGAESATLQVLPVDYGWEAGLAAVLYMVVSFLLLWLVPSRGARWLAWSFFAFACWNLSSFGGSFATTGLGLSLYLAGGYAFAPLGIRALQTFPEATARTGRFAPWWPWLFVGYGVVYSAQFVDWPISIPPQHPLVLVAQAGTALVFLGMIINNYRNSPPRERRQLAWVLLGVWLAMLFPILGGIVQLAIGPTPWIVYLMTTTSIFLPISVLIALTWYNLGDVNRLLSSAAAYGLLGIAFVGAVYLLVLPAAQAFSATTGAEPATIQSLLSFLLTVGAVVAGVRLPNLFERRFFPERFALERGVGGVLEALSTSRTPRELAERLERSLGELLQPDALTVFLRTGRALAPVAGGTHEAEPLPLDDAAVQRVFARDQPLAGIDLQRALGDGTSPLSALGARVLVPVRRGGEATALIALGDKQSGDVYTRSDLAHLGAVGARVALELQRYETDEIVRSGREMVDEMRREKQLAEIESRAKTRFLAAASHDLRQPLHALGLYVETLRERMGAEDAAHADLVRQIDRSAATLGETIDALLDVSKLDAGAMVAHPVDFELGPLLERLVEGAGPLAAAKSLALRLVPTRLRVTSDPVLLARIVRNLLVNAVNYTERGRVLVGCRRSGRDVSIEVWDTGPGIPEADRERIFAEFTRGRAPAASGTGLGLAIVRGMAELLDHAVSLDSQVGRGTVFRVRVRRARTTAPESAAPAAAPGALTGTIALLEDDESVRAGTKALLERWGARVVATPTLEGLLERLEGAPDAILADFDLGGGPDGLASIARLRERFGAEIPALILTGTAAPDLGERCAAQGIPLLSKPLRPAQLRAALSALRSTSRSRA